MRINKKVVIVGGGFTGAYCAKRLQNKFQVILIDNKEHFEFTPSIIKSISDPRNLRKIQISHKTYLNKGEFLHAEVKEVGKNYVLVNNEKINFDYLIIASGSRYTNPIKSQNILTVQRSKDIRDFHEKLKVSKKILIVGGGIVGVELASDIITKYKDKKITLIDSNSELIPRNNKKTRNHVKAFLEAHGVSIINNEKIIKSNKQTFFTDRGREITPDMFFLCTGITSNSEFMNKNFKDNLNEKGQIKTNEYLQMDGFDNIFVGGDVTDILEEKTAQNAEDHAQIILKNIMRLENGKGLKKYKLAKKSFVISLGKNRGVFEKGNASFYGLTPALLKKLIELKTMIRYR